MSIFKIVYYRLWRQFQSHFGHWCNKYIALQKSHFKRTIDFYGLTHLFLFIEYLLHAKHKRYKNTKNQSFNMSHTYIHSYKHTHIHSPSGPLIFLRENVLMGKYNWEFSCAIKSLKKIPTGLCLTSVGIIRKNPKKKF